MSLEIFPIDDFLNSLNTKIKKKQLPESTEGLSNDASLGKEWQETHQEEESRLNLDGKKDDLKEKTNWAWFAKIYTSVVTFFIFLTVFLCLIGKVKIHFQWGQFLSELSIGNFHLSDTVLIAFITTTFVSVLGLCFIVLEYYFKKQNKR